MGEFKIEIICFSATPIQTVCGNVIPAVIDTPDNVAYVRFSSDESQNSAGFQLRFTTSEDGKPANQIIIIYLVEIEVENYYFLITYSINFCLVCGGELTGSAGTISSPNYPNLYDHARVCTWLITVATDRRVTMTFLAFDIENGHEEYGCVWDYLEVTFPS